MKLVSYVQNNVSMFGAVVDNEVVQLSDKIAHRSIRDLIAADDLAQAAAVVRNSDSGTPLTEIEYLLPIADPQKIICVGVNYMNRNAEYKDGTGAPEYPSLFMRSILSFSPHDQDILIPPESDQFDYEGEIVIVIGRGGRRISQADAPNHIAGLTIMNEGSIRDWLRHAKFNVTQGKNFDRSGAIGPWIQTDLAGVNMTDMKIETRVNGETRQSDTTASMAFPFAKIIEYISTFATLTPGDLIATGTPTGAGARFDPPRWLVPGDTVEVEVEGVGTLFNRVAAEQL
jgi:2-keto-4-pentenoate hydratase/2-oxohepta-3-ene-1,7-dioic acid hydratase in catechol pathway